MPLSRRSVLPLLMLLLQVFAPLLHAHTGAQNPHSGLHVPGLETIATVASKPHLLADNRNLSAAPDFVFAIDEGIREKKASGFEASPEPSALLPLCSILIAAAAEHTLPAEFAEPSNPPGLYRSPSPSPRAPPFSQI